MSRWTYRYKRGAELDALTLPWQIQDEDGTRTDRDLTTGYTFSFTLTREGSDTPALEKTEASGVVGLANGVRIDWRADDLDLSPGRYEVALTCTTVAGGLDLFYGEPGYPSHIEIV